jgi:hypothetical protein
VVSSLILLAISYTPHFFFPVFSLFFFLQPGNSVWRLLPDNLNLQGRECQNLRGSYCTAPMIAVLMNVCFSAVVSLLGRVYELSLLEVLRPVCPMDLRQVIKEPFLHWAKPMALVRRRTRKSESCNLSQA